MIIHVGPTEVLLPPKLQNAASRTKTLQTYKPKISHDISWDFKICLKVPQDASKAAEQPSLSIIGTKFDYLTAVMVSMPSIGVTSAKVRCIQPSEFWGWAGTITPWLPIHSHWAPRRLLQELFRSHATTRSHSCCDITPHHHRARINRLRLSILTFLCRCLTQARAEVVVVVVVMDIRHSHFWVVLMKTLEIELISMNMVVIGNGAATFIFQVGGRGAFQRFFGRCMLCTMGCYRFWICAFWACHFWLTLLNVPVVAHVVRHDV